MKTVLSFFATVLFSSSALPQTSAEVMCRAQAKEVAVQTYSACITDARNSRVEEIRKNYQKELADLKAKYDRELKEMGGGKAGNKKRSAAKTTQPPVPAKGVAKTLPSRTATEGEALPVQSVAEGAKVVSIGSDEDSNSVEREAAEADQVEFIDMPIE